MLMTVKLRWIVLSTTLFATAANAQVVTSHGTVLGQSCYLQTRISGDNSRALETCTLALERDLMGANDRAATFDNRGVILDRMQRLEEADADFLKAISLRPDLGDAYVNRGAIQIKKKQYDAALALTERGIGLGTSLPYLAEYNRALALQLLGRNREAYEGYRKALALEPGFVQAAERLKDFSVVRRPAAPVTN
jgi:tetratricopeptide (TPR) repeat protein